MKIYAITHAHTEQAADVAVDEWHLSLRGLEQARALATASFWPQVDRVVVTSEPKTWLTVADVVRARQLPVWIDSRLDELRREGWSENYAEQVAAVFAEPSRSIGGWESVAQVQARASQALDDLQQRFAGETLAVVGHGLCLSIVRATILGHDPVDFVAWRRLSFGSYAWLSWNPSELISDFAMNADAVR